MFRNKIGSAMALLLLAAGANAAASTLENPPAAPLPEPENAYWIFSGMVTNEGGENFGYFFQMERQGMQFQVHSALLDSQTNKVIFSYDQEEKLETPVDNKWKVGNAFLRFNPINESWVFGVKTAEKKGFNFKVDMLNTPIERSETQTLRPGLEALVHQTSRLNGHIQAEGKEAEQFVTANNAWFSKVWLSAKQDSAHNINSSFCRLNDGSGFYTENLKETDARLAFLASWRDAAGNPVKMSQFMNKDLLNDKTWKISLMLPKLEFTLVNLLENNAANHLAAGFFQEAPKGFCFFSQQEFIA